jgi:hypothetical protein
VSKYTPTFLKEAFLKTVSRLQDLYYLCVDRTVITNTSVFDGNCDSIIIFRIKSKVSTNPTVGMLRYAVSGAAVQFNTRCMVRRAGWGEVQSAGGDSGRRAADARGEPARQAERGTTLVK